jgi:hypothetical protein
VDATATSIGDGMTTECDRCRDHRRKETFHYLWHSYEYDIDLAHRLVNDGREPVEVEEESVRASIDRCTIVKEHVFHVDARLPGIIAHIRFTDADGEVYRGHVLIDGNHRAARCLSEQLPFWAYLLTEQESQQVLLRSPRDVAPSQEEAADRVGVVQSIA